MKTNTDTSLTPKLETIKSSRELMIQSLNEETKELIARMARDLKRVNEIALEIDRLKKTETE